MKKSNAQAERHSNRAGLLRASRPRTDIFEQNDLASSVVRYVFHDHFFYFLIDYKHKHTAVASWFHVVHLPPTPYIFNRLQAQAHSNRRGQPRLSRPFFFIFLIK